MIQWRQGRFDERIDTEAAVEVYNTIMARAQSGVSAHAVTMKVLFVDEVA